MHPNNIPPQCPTPRPGAITANGESWLAVGHVSCQTWSCPSCGPRKGWKLRKRIERAQPNRFITLTHKPNGTETPADALRRMRHDWHTLTKALNRRQKHGNIKYVCVVEWTRKGWPHLHVLANCDYLRQRTLSGLWRSIHGAPIVDIRAVKESEKTASYLAKYLTKSNATPPRMRRWSATPGFLPPAEIYLNPSWPDDTTYQYTKLDPITVANNYIDAGYTPLPGPNDTIILVAPPLHPRPISNPEASLPTPT